MKTLAIVLASLLCVPESFAITYDAWKAQVFTSAEVLDPQVSGELADPDKDGICNLLEYAMNGSPKVWNPGQLPQTARVGNAVTLQYTRRRETLDLDFIVEVSTDLVTWTGGFQKVWTTDAVPNATVVTNGVSLVIADRVTATSQLPTSTNAKQFLRLKVIRSPRAGILQAITRNGNNPTTLITQSVVPSGPYAGAITKYPAIAPHVGNYVAHWYFGAQALANFVDTQPAVAKAFVEAYLGHLDVENGQSTNRIHDFDLHSDISPPFWSLLRKVRSDSDDAYAATVLLVAGKLKRLYPSDTWFDQAWVRQGLKNVAYANITTQAKSETVYESESAPAKTNRSIKVFQNGDSNIEDPDPADPMKVLQVTNYPVGFLEDNVQVWAGLNEFVIALEMVERTSSDVTYYKAWRDQILTNIHDIFWDSKNQAWRANDTTTLKAGMAILHCAQPNPYSAALQCQLFPELYNMPYPGGDTAETQRRYNMAWKWVTDHMPNWPDDSAWPYSDQFSHVEIAVVAARHGEMLPVAAFLTMASGRWLPGGKVANGTVSEQIGYWQALAGYSPPPASAPAFFPKSSWPPAPRRPSGPATPAKATPLARSTPAIATASPAGPPSRSAPLPSPAKRSR